MFNKFIRSLQREHRTAVGLGTFGAISGLALAIIGGATLPAIGVGVVLAGFTLGVGLLSDAIDRERAERGTPDASEELAILLGDDRIDSSPLAQMPTMRNAFGKKGATVTAVAKSAPPVFFNGGRKI